MPRLILALCLTILAAAGARAAGADDARHGRKLAAEAGCGSCHSIPGVANAHGLVGPPLDNIGERTIIAGLLPNTPENMIRWLEMPQSIVPGNAMPDLGLSERDAADIAAYLATLKRR